MYKDWPLAVVVPAYCERRILPRTLAGIPPFVDHIVVVDDASPDDTYDQAMQAAKGDGRIHVVRLGYNRGVGGAICQGYRQALLLGARAVVVMAADDQMDPADLPALLEPLVQGEADYVKGNRLAHRQWRAMPWLRRLGTQSLARLTTLASGLEGLEDTQCGYTAISADILARLELGALYPRYGYPNDLLIHLARLGGRVAQVPVRPVYADEVSGLRIPRVVGPIAKILARGALWRVSGGRLGGP